MDSGALCYLDISGLCQIDQPVDDLALTAVGPCQILDSLKRRREHLHVQIDPTAFGRLWGTSCAFANASTV